MNNAIPEGLIVPTIISAFVVWVIYVVLYADRKENDDE